MEYKMKTTFLNDFLIADSFGEKAIQDTFNRAFKEWKTNLVYITELAMVMSWQSCSWYEKNQTRSFLYADLYHKVDDWALNHLKGKDLDYYIKTTDQR